MHALDYAVVVAYFAAVLGIGLYFSRRNSTMERYYLGGRDFPGWAIGISFIGSTISSITFIAYPADSFKTAWVRILINFAYPLVVAVAALLFLPLFRNGVVRSAYHYLRLRFGASISIYVAIVYLAARLVLSSTIVYLLSVLLAAITGISIPACLLIAAGVTALYTIKGGFDAVVWADVLQTTVLLLGAFLCIGMIVAALPGGVAQVVDEAWAAGKLAFSDLDATGRLVPVEGGFSLVRKTAPMLMLVGAAQYIAGQLDQDTVQRWCSARSDREARKSMVVLGLGALPIWVTFMFLGTCLWVYYQHFPSETASAILAGTRKAEEILPHFITSVLPPGICGLVVAAALAAAMGAVSSNLSASSMVWVNDIYRPYFAPDRTDAHYVRVGRGAALVIAVLMTLGAWAIYRSAATTIMELSITLLALAGGGIAGAFLFGILTQRGDARSVAVGIGSTMAFSAYSAAGQAGWVPLPFSPYYTSVLGNLLMFAACWAASVVLPSQVRDLTNLTVWTTARRTARASS